MFPGAYNPGGEFALLMLAMADATDDRLRTELEARDASRDASPAERRDIEQGVAEALELKRSVLDLGRGVTPGLAVDAFVVHHLTLLNDLEVDLTCCPTVVAILMLHTDAANEQDEDDTDADAAKKQRSTKGLVAGALAALALLICICGCMRMCLHRICCGGGGDDEPKPRSKKRAGFGVEMSRARRGGRRRLDDEEDDDEEDEEDFEESGGQRVSID